jgi:dTDP-glucose 4,6-dehydratase
MKLLVTGGCGFIGNHFIREYLKTRPEDQIVNLDLLTYAGRLENTKDFAENPNYTFIKGDVADPVIVRQAMEGCDSAFHFAAES